MITRVHPLNSCERVAFVVNLARYDGRWLFVRHKARATWETPGGHIEPNETALEAAGRELYEETGALDYALTPLCDYSVQRENGLSYGRVFAADIRTLGPLPESEIAETRLFDALPDENIGLQWEPCHHMVQLVDPLPMLRKWVNKIICLHGKDATIDWDVVNRRGIYSGEPFAWHRTPGFGDTNSTDINSILRMNVFKGSIDIEGYHDPVYNGDLEWTGQVYALNYLKQCKGGEFIKIER